jgi:hypothetical protein
LKNQYFEGIKRASFPWYTETPSFDDIVMGGYIGSVVSAALIIATTKVRPFTKRWPALTILTFSIGTVTELIIQEKRYNTINGIYNTGTITADSLASLKCFYSDASHRLKCNAYAE